MRHSWTAWSAAANGVTVLVNSLSSALASFRSGVLKPSDAGGEFDVRRMFRSEPPRIDLDGTVQASRGAAPIGHGWQGGEFATSVPSFDPAFGMKWTSEMLPMGMLAI